MQDEGNIFILRYHIRHFSIHQCRPESAEHSSDFSVAMNGSSLPFNSSNIHSKVKSGEPNKSSR